MEVELNKKYPLAVSRASAWAVLMDIRAVAGCMPGAQITDQVDETHYKGLVRSKVGPAVMSFTGDIEVLCVDAGAQRLELLGKGSDKGGSSAAMKLVARLEDAADATSCLLLGDATVTVSGKLAQFGGRLLVPIADAMLAQFAANFETAARAVASVPAVLSPAIADVTNAAPSSEVADTPGAAPTMAPPLEAASDTPTFAAVARDVAPPVRAATTTLPTVATAPAWAAPVAASAASPNELNALGLLWIVVRSWFLGLFGKKTA
jgi:carbon monoxide dehydrogenase subunit G